ncbi:MAG: hypothetical protein KDI50_06475 [Candidatus Competibacteraceae bacterium]|nr:hypothetical protein [Candidatus Competibacteraceae bacterium]
MLQQTSLPGNSILRPDDEWNKLKAHFVALWARCVNASQPAIAKSIYERLVEYYEGVHRHYHTLAHIRHCLYEFNQAAACMDDPDAVEIALWFHDAIYEPGAKDNEQRSAELFQKYAEASGCADSAFQRRIDNLIMITTHREQPSRKDEQFIVDIDLSGFGLPWDAFEQDGRRIRAECTEISDDVYYSGLIKFLQMLQERPTFFFTDFFQERYERAARKNIKRLITSLHKCGYH